MKKKIYKTSDKPKGITGIKGGKAVKTEAEKKLIARRLQNAKISEWIHG